MTIECLMKYSFFLSFDRHHVSVCYLLAWITTESGITSDPTVSKCSRRKHCVFCFPFSGFEINFDNCFKVWLVFRLRLVQAKFSNPAIASVEFVTPRPVETHEWIMISLCIFILWACSRYSACSHSLKFSCHVICNFTFAGLTYSIYCDII